MKIYHYCAGNGELLFQGIADASPLEDDVWLVPAQATDIEPPDTGDREAAVFSGNAWSVVPDWRGVPLWLTNTGEKTSITEVGIAPAGMTDVERPSDAHVWSNGAWIIDPALHVSQLTKRFAERLSAINGAAAEALFDLSAAYPDGEVQSWPQQVREAEAFADNVDAPAPLLSAIAAARGVPVGLLAERVRAKTQAYAIASGAIIGNRQRLEDAIAAIDLEAPDAAAQLEAITWGSA